MNNILLQSFLNKVQPYQKDLEFRWPGEFLGERQSGILDLVIQAIKNIELVNLVQNLAKELITKNPKLIGSPLLIREVKRGETMIS